MAKKAETKIKRDKTRIPVPQKPPKMEESGKAYNRRKVNKETRDILSEKDKSVSGRIKTNSKVKPVNN